MTNHDVHPAASEPNSIAPMALDTNQWKIDLNDLHSGDVRLDFSVRPVDDEDDLEIPGVAFSRPRTGRRIVGVMTAMLVVAGLGFAAFRGRPALQRAYASASARSAPAAKPAVVAVTALQAPPAPAPVAPIVLAAPSTPVAVDTMPTMSANALPNAKAEKVKRAAGKRRGK